MTTQSDGEKTMVDTSLTDTITEAYNELEPTEVDNLEVSEDEIVLQDSDELEVEEDLDEEETETEDIEEGDEEESADDDDSEKYVVKVDGESLEVSLDELKAGYSRQAHFTKSMQALKEEKESFDIEASQFVETVQGMQELDAAWESNPISVLTNLITSVEQPEYALGLLIKELATLNALSPEALQYFNIDNDTLGSWKQESEVDALRRQVREKEELEAQIKSEADSKTQELQIQNAIANFERTIDDIISNEELEFRSDAEQLKFRADLLGYAKDNNILDLNKAFAAMQYESNKSRKRSSNVETKRTAKKVISKGGASGQAVTPVSNGKEDLRTIIENTMKELS